MEEKIKDDDNEQLSVINPEGLFDDEDSDEVIELKPVTETVSLKTTVLEMILIMALWGILCQIVILVFFKDKLGCSIGMWLGVIMALASSVHMAWSFDMAMELESKAAQSKIHFHAILRYVVIVILVAVILFTEFANPFAAFVGVMALKVSAYLQPLAHKVLNH